MLSDFQELIKLLNVIEIRFMDTHETVVNVLYPEDNSEIQIKSETQYLDIDPQVEESTLVFHPKYRFSFSVDEKEFFRAEYQLLVVFSSSDSKRSRELLEEKEVKDLFLQKQMNRTLWSILRGTILDSFNRHSLRPVTLPWII